MGQGRVDDNPLTTEGCSWNFRDGRTVSTLWRPPISASGGNWFTGSGFEASHSLTHKTKDIRMDVTDIVNKWISGSITNNGFIIKRADSQEFTAKNEGELNFFSMDTHTIFPPFLDISWDDSVYEPRGPQGGINATDDNTKIKRTGECYVTLRNNKEKFRTSEEYKFRLNIRELYPTRKFTTTSNFLDVNYFTSRSFYSLVDYATEEVVIPFDDHTKLSADSEGMYFKLYMNGLQEERYYKLLFKHENSDGIKRNTNGDGFTAVSFYEHELEHRHEHEHDREHEQEKEHEHEHGSEKRR